MRRLCSNADDAASRSRASIAGLLALLVATLAEVIGSCMDHDCSAENAVLADQLDVAVADAALGIALVVGLEVTEVANMALIIAWGAVSLAVGVVMRTSAGAAVGVVTELVDMHATLGTGIVVLDVPSDSGGRGLGGLLEGHLAGDLGVSSEDGNCFDHFDGVVSVYK